MTAPELKPCPFCGGEASISKDHDPDGNGAFYAVKCRKCRAKSPEIYAVETCNIHFAQVRDAWNRRADLAAVQPAQVRVKPLVWGKWGEAKGGGAKYSTYEFGNNGLWNCVCYPHEAEQYRLARGVTLDAAKAAAQADYAARILAAIEPQPDPRDEVIARLVEAVDVTLHDIDDLVANSAGVAGLHMNGEVAEWEALLDGGAFGSWLESVEKLRAALAAAKAVRR